MISLVKKNEKLVGKFKLETPKNIWFDEFVCLGIKISSFKCGNGIKNKLKCPLKAQSKHKKFKECRKCVDGGKNGK